MNVRYQPVVAASIETPSSGSALFKQAWPILIISCLVGILYASVLQRLVWQWYDDPNYSHGFVVPLFSAYLLWHNRKTFLSRPPRPSQYGVPVILGSLGLLFLGSLGAELFLQRISLWGTIVGLTLYFWGAPRLKAMAFPLGFLLFMIPLPAIIYNQIVFPLQLIASQFATTCLEKVNVVPVLREGNLLILPRYTLAVVEACSGIRSLMSMLALSVGYGYLAECNFVIRAALTVAMVPVVIISNGIRVMTAALLVHHIGAGAAEGFLHTFSGWVIFLTATVLLLALHSIITVVRRGWHRKSEG
jgi:exosortase